MATELLDIGGSRFELRGDVLRNLDTQLPITPRFPKEPGWSEFNPVRPAGKPVVFQADVVLALPLARNIVTWSVKAFTELQAAYKRWNWLSRAVYESPDTIPVDWWFDKHIFRVEWSLVPPTEELDIAWALVPPILGGIAAVLAAAGFLVLTVRVKRPTVALGVIAVIVVGALLLLGKRD